MPLKKVSLKDLAKKTEGYSGADIEGICREAGIIAMRKDKDAKEVNMDCFEKALKVVHSSLDEQTVKYYEMISKELQGGIDKRKKEDTGVGYYS
jgi:transitional endoplasmic reticulum ATPase